jgi:hypothetical protein
MKPGPTATPIDALLGFALSHGMSSFRSFAGILRLAKKSLET